MHLSDSSESEHLPTMTEMEEYLHRLNEKIDDEIFIYPKFEVVLSDFTTNEEAKNASNDKNLSCVSSHQEKATRSQEKISNKRRKEKIHIQNLDSETEKRGVKSEKELEKEISLKEEASKKDEQISINSQKSNTKTNIQKYPCSYKILDPETIKSQADFYYYKKEYQKSLLCYISIDFSKVSNYVLRDIVEDIENCLKKLGRESDEGLEVDEESLIRGLESHNCQTFSQLRDKILN